jgi:hypothetical protein
LKKEYYTPSRAIDKAHICFSMPPLPADQKGYVFPGAGNTLAVDVTGHSEQDQSKIVNGRFLEVVCANGNHGVIKQGGKLHSVRVHALEVRLEKSRAKRGFLRKLREREGR